MPLRRHQILFLIARLILSVHFVGEIVDKLLHFDPWIRVIRQAGFPWAPYLFGLVVFLLIVGTTLLILNRYLAVGVGALLLVQVPCSLWFESTTYVKLDSVSVLGGLLMTLAYHDFQNQVHGPNGHSFLFGSSIDEEDEDENDRSFLTAPLLDPEDPPNNTINRTFMTARLFEDHLAHLSPEPEVEENNERNIVEKANNENTLVAQNRSLSALAKDNDIEENPDSPESNAAVPTNDVNDDNQDTAEKKPIKNSQMNTAQTTVAPTARDRWKILRQAILKSAANSKEQHQVTSLHSFPGYRLIQPMRLSPKFDWETVRERLKGIRIDSVPLELTLTEFCVQTIHDTFLAMETIRNSEAATAPDDGLHQLRIGVVARETTIDEMKQIDCSVVMNKLRDLCGFGAKSSLTLRSSSVSCVGMQLNYDFLPNRKETDHYKVQCYQISNNANVEKADMPEPLYIRERMSRQHFSLKELMNTPEKVDNTGNVCVWDSEKTMTWIMTMDEHLKSKHYDIVLELGAGMAGLAGLSLARRAKRIILTDGHEQCVQNNRINCRLLEATSDSEAPSLAKLDCQVLLWSLEDPSPDLQGCADLTLVSDCTHFEHFHGQLLWTLLSCSKVNGQVYMCQPDRGESLQNFLKLIQNVNERPRAESPLVQVEERTFDKLDQIHNDLVADGSGADGQNKYYRPNVHRPRIIVLTKLRALEHEDRSVIVKHTQKQT